MLSRLTLVALLAVSFWPVTVHADATSTLELSELMPDPAAPLTDEHDEFTEIHNNGDQDLDITGYALKISTHVYTFKGVIVPADGYTTVTSAESTLSLPNTGGTMQLLAPGGAVIDTTTYTTAKTGWSWAKIDGVWAWTNQVTEGDDNAASIITVTASPTASPVAGLGNAASPASASGSPLLITELLPDPASPLTDAADEYIELLNPSTDTVNVTGYALKTGKTLSSHYALTGSIAPGAYAVYKSAQTHLQLANAGSSVALYDASGAQIDATVSYGVATTGAGWARFADGWSWTTTPTPGADNILTTPPVKAAVTTAAKSSKSSSAAAATSKAAKTSTAKKLSTKAASTAKTAYTKTAAVATAAAKGSGAWLLFVLGGLTIGFVIYEFRHDVIDLYQRTRSYIRRRRQAGN